MDTTVNNPINSQSPFKLCFVCLGNICRSPTAEGLFQHLVNERQLQSCFEVDSAGTSAYHIGEPANSKSRQIAAAQGVALHSKARQFEYFDLEYFDLILPMDRENLKNIRHLDTANKYDEKVMLLREFDPAPDDQQVPDPYYGGLNGFENVFDIIHRSCEHLLDELATHIRADAS